MKKKLLLFLIVLLCELGNGFTQNISIGAGLNYGGPLPTKVIHKVVQKFVMQLEVQLAERNVTFDLTDEAVEWLANKGYDERMGARPLGRVIQEHIKKPLANELLFGKLTKGGTVKVKIGKDEAGKTEIELESIPIRVSNSSTVT